MSEETIPEQDRQGVTPLRIDGRLVAPNVGSVHNVVMHQSGQMDELHNNGQVDVTGADRTGRGTGQQGDDRAKAFAAAAAGVLEIALDGRVKGFGLFANSLFDGIEVWVDQLDGSLQLGCAQALKS